MKSDGPYMYCPGGNCPLKDSCKRYVANMTPAFKRRHWHWHTAPGKKDKCQYLDPKDSPANTTTNEN